MEITFADIDRVAHLMGKDFSDSERTSVIQVLESCDINACPGSGKTTTMVAKLLILSEKIAGSMSGICALSHTNAAKDEIKKTFGSHSGALMRYPHFVGTIQAFTDLYLAIPAYIEEFGHRPIAVDDDLYENIARREYPNLSYPARSCLQHQLNPSGIDYFCGVSFSYSGFNLVYFNGSEERAFPAGVDRPAYQGTLALKNALLRKGYLTYHDAFAFANRYLQKYPHLAQIISSRFSYVFIDEMQDTDAFQNELIETIFHGHSIIQKFGDPNQAIYGQRSQGGVSIWRPDGNYSIRTSRRLSTSISRISQGICSQSNEIIGNDRIPNHQHTIIMFTQARSQDVIHRFGQIIEEQNLREGPFKALGAIGRPNQNPNHLSLTSYWPAFQSRLQQNSANNPFWGLVQQAHLSIIRTNKYSEAYQLLTRGFTELLHVQQIRTNDGRLYNPTQFLKAIRDSGSSNYHQYKGLLLANCESLMTVGELDLNNTILQAQLIFSYIGLQFEGLAEVIIRSHGEVDEPSQPPLNASPNSYFYSPDIPIEVNTIHSAKGQTHQATLVLETYFYQSDLPTILPFLVGENIRHPGVRVITHYLPLTYVACTRPSHLLCLAIQVDHLDISKQNQLRSFGWQIDYSLV